VSVQVLEGPILPHRGGQVSMTGGRVYSHRLDGRADRLNDR